jgi:hypothetical protein
MTPVSEASKIHAPSWDDRHRPMCGRALPVWGDEAITRDMDTWQTVLESDDAEYVCWECESITS